MDIKIMDSSYGFLGNHLGDMKMKRMLAIKDIIKKSYNDDNFSKCFDGHIEYANKQMQLSDPGDIKCALSSVLDSLPTFKYDCSNIDKLINILFIIKYLLTTYIDKQYSAGDMKYGDEIIEILENIVEKIETIIESDLSILENDSVNCLITTIGKELNGLKIKKLASVPYVSPKDKYKAVDGSMQATGKNVMTESSDGATIIKSITNYSVPKYYTQLTKRVFDPTDYIKSVFGEHDTDYLVNKVYKLSDLTSAYSLKLDNKDVYDSLVNVIEFFYYKLFNNSTGLTILKDELDKCIEILRDTVSPNESNKNAIDSMILFMLRYGDAIKNLFKKFESNNIQMENVPLIEMGFGFIYDIIPSNIEDMSEDDIKAVGEAMVETISDMDMMDVLTEGIFRKAANSIDVTVNGIGNGKRKDDYEFSRRKQSDEYEFGKRKREDKYELKKRKKDDDYELDKRKKEDEYQTKKEEKERRKNATKTAGMKWKTLKLSTPAVWQAVRALKRLLTAGAIGGVSIAAGLNPIFLPIVYLITRYMRDKVYPDSTKREIMMEIRQTLNLIDSKIEEADRKNDMKQKYSLMKMKEKLTSLYNKNNYTSGRNAVV